ncbi:MAG: glycosyltransferase family 2 protein, partial [Anaerolineales bacterium]
MKDQKLAIIVVSWNTVDLLDGCLKSVRMEAAHLDQGWIKTYVVDNASTDGSASMVLANYPEVELIQNQDNLGFAGANNQAIRRSRSEYILLLNPDCELKPGSLRALIEFMDATPSAGAAGSRLVGPDRSLQPSAFPIMTLGREFWRLFHFDKLHHVSSYPLT